MTSELIPKPVFYTLGKVLDVAAFKPGLAPVKGTKTKLPKSEILAEIGRAFSRSGLLIS